MNRGAGFPGYNVLHSAQFVAAREELFFMLRAAPISWWDRRFARHRRL
jgi:hypothetical protein